MIKQKLFTVIGIIFSLIIVFGGWQITSKLLEIHETSLLLVVGNVAVSPNSSTTSIDEINYPPLSNSEIFTILNIWEFSTKEIPHEPEAGQLSMEQAIVAGKKGLIFFSEHDLLPSEFNDYNKINAYLSKKSLDGSRLMPISIDINIKDIRNNVELAPFCSYWTMTFSSNKAKAILVINAVTGQIWKAKIEYPTTTTHLATLDEKTIKDDFYTYLGLEDNTLLDAVVNKNNFKIDDVSSRLVLDIYLIAKY